MEIRPAWSTDATACVEILSDWIDETPWMPRLHSRASMIGFWSGRLAEADGWLAVDDERIVGFCLRDGEDVTALYLRPDARGRGVGRALLDRAKEDRDALSLWVFDANEPARMFYARAGFTEGHRTEGENEEGLPDIRMHWARRPGPTV